MLSNKFLRQLPHKRVSTLGRACNFSGFQFFATHQDGKDRCMVRGLCRDSPLATCPGSVCNNEHGFHPRLGVYNRHSLLPSAFFQCFFLPSVAALRRINRSDESRTRRINLNPLLTHPSPMTSRARSTELDFARLDGSRHRKGEGPTPPSKGSALVCSALLPPGVCSRSRRERRRAGGRGKSGER